MYQRYFKRWLDFLFSTCLLILICPMLIIIGLCIKFDSSGPVIFKQKRIGKDGKNYVIYKFRTMQDKSQDTGTGLFSFSNDERVTRVGKVLRAASLDELPQLINIIKGDMAIVGPRPPVFGGFPDYVDLNEHMRKRFNVLPGVTGLAQVNGRNELSWDEKITFDNLYIDLLEEKRILIDLKIIGLTIVRVLRQSGVYENPDNIKNADSIFKQNNKNL